MSRQVPTYLREAVRRWNNQPIWYDRLWLVVIYALFFLMGIVVDRAFWSRPEHQLREVIAVADQALKTGEECAFSLREMTRVAVVMAMNEPRIRAVSR